MIFSQSTPIYVPKNHENASAQDMRQLYYWHCDWIKETFRNYVAIFLGKMINLKCQCCPHIETSQLICCENQLTDIYLRTNTGT